MRDFGSQPVPLADETTLHVGGTPRRMVNAATEQEMLEVLDSPQFGMVGDEPLLVLGGGSNLVVSGDPFPGTVLRDRRSDIQPSKETVCDGTIVNVAAGTNWDEVVQWAVEENLSGIEALSGIPGSAGAATVQNIGAYGREIARNLVGVRVFDRVEGRVFSLPKSALDLSYRNSIIKESLSSKAAGGGRLWGPTGRWVILSIKLCLANSEESAPIRYRELAETLGVSVGQGAPLAAVREAVLAIRRSKGMVYNPADHDTWSVGSFFVNPILEETEADHLLPFSAPRFPVADVAKELRVQPQRKTENPPTYVKTSAAWLLERAGFHKGFGLTPDARARLSTKHVLAITNRGGATTSDIVDLARAVRDGVQEHFSITLHPEPVLVGVEI